MTKGGRFEALDSLRGVCACLVILCHSRTTGLITNTDFARNSWLFVDFFFVLSGFVISASYRDRLLKGFLVRWFMWLRLGRVYPLHFAVLALFVAFEAFKMVAPGVGVSQIRPFTSPHSPAELWHSLALIQIFGIDTQDPWNGPSWSIAAEVWTYLLAVLAFSRARGWSLPLIGGAVVCSFAFLSLDGHAFLARHYSMGLVRCVYGFGVGALAYSAFEKWRERTVLSAAAESGIEVLVVLMTAAYVATAGKGFATMLAPWCSPLRSWCFHWSAAQSAPYYD